MQVFLMNKDIEVMKLEFEEDKNNLMNGSIMSAMNGNLELLNRFFNNMLKEKEVIKEHQK